MRSKLISEIKPHKLTPGFPPCYERASLNKSVCPNARFTHPHFQVGGPRR
jgi:hypothetical protein